MVNYNFIDRMPFRWVTSKGLPKPLQIGHKDLAEPKLLSTILEGKESIHNYLRWDKE